MKNILKSWIAWIFKIPQTFIITYEQDGKKVLVTSVAVRGKRTKTNKFLVEHFVDDDLQATDEMLTREREMFPSIVETDEL